MSAFLVASLVVSLTACTSAEGPDVRFRTHDGFTIAAELHVPDAPATPAPLVVLGHQLDRDRRSWQRLIPRLVEAGYAVIAVDHRGFGGSTAEASSPAALSDAARAGLGEDLLGAIGVAGARAGVDTSRVAAIGTGLSATAAVRCARERPAVRTLVLLAGMVEADDEEFLLAHPDLPLLLVAAGGDANGVALMRQYAGRFSGPDQIYVEMAPVGPEDAADWRGTDGLLTDTGLAELLLWFLERHFPPQRER